MRTEQRVWNPPAGWVPGPVSLGDAANLVLVFGGRELLEAGQGLDALQTEYPNARVVGCSTAGEIHGTRVEDGTLVATAVAFASSRVEAVQVAAGQAAESRQAGIALGKALPQEGLVHVFVLSDGHVVNGSELVRGVESWLPQGVAVTGGLAGDGDRFEKTLVFADSAPKQGHVVAVGFYGDRLRIGYGSLGGWDAFGPMRRITKAEGNVLYELDGQPALELYKTYLGEHAAGLPSAGLLFPLMVQPAEGGQEVVRTLLAVDEDRHSLTFAGDLADGGYARLMKANFDRLVDGAEGAARTSVAELGDGKAELAILISCVGRKLVLRQRTEEELEAVREVLGKQTVMTGFYSYGEICPVAHGADCQLHNQTMTITTVSED